MLSHEYKIVIDRGVGAPGHEKYVVDSLRSTEKTISYSVDDNCKNSWCRY